MSSLLFLCLCIYFTFSSAELVQDSSKYIFNSRGHDHFLKAKATLNADHNNTYYETPDNMMRVPIAQFNDDLQKKKQTNKKSPKRTVQKIIKKHKNTRRFYFNQVTSQPTQPARVKLDENAFLDDDADKRDGVFTTQVNQRKKIRNRNSKLQRYPMPFQRFQSRQNNGIPYKRMRREADRDNTLIVQDLDEVEFLKSKDDYDIVKVHSKKYW